MLGIEAETSDITTEEAPVPCTIADEEVTRRLREAVRIYVTGALRVAAQDQMRLRAEARKPIESASTQPSGADSDSDAARGGADQ